MIGREGPSVVRTGRQITFSWLGGCHSGGSALIVSACISPESNSSLKRSFTMRCRFTSERPLNFSDTITTPYLRSSALTAVTSHFVGCKLERMRSPISAVLTITTASQLTPPKLVLCRHYQHSVKMRAKVGKNKICKRDERDEIT
ncbi:hypothetical protein TRVL_02235 [Trypanosoma vivax]|nr:hypothetical protein TRVL_02235 [Trypanosoma vivax]